MYPAQDYFQVNRTTGVISLVRDLRTDSLNLQSYTVSCLYLIAKFHFLLHLSVCLVDRFDGEVVMLFFALGIKSYL